MDNQPPARLAKIILIGLSSLIGTTPILLPATLSSHLAPLITLLSPEAVSQILLGMIGLLLLSITFIILLRPQLTWDEHIGAWKHRFTETRYCARCKANKKLIIPLKNGEHGWYCMACNRAYSDPARPKLQQPRRRHINPYN